MEIFMEIFFWLFGGFFGPGHIFGWQARAAFVIMPMRGHTVFGVVIHRLGANLKFDDMSAFAKNRGMERLVAVRFGLSDIIFDPAFERMPNLVYHSERRVAVTDIFDDDAQSDHVVNFFNFPIFV